LKILLENAGEGIVTQKQAPVLCGFISGIFLSANTLKSPSEYAIITLNWNHLYKGEQE